MPRRARQLAESEIYHVIMRGVNRDVIFLETADYERFLYALRLSKDLSGSAVLAYCLMNNHLHVVMRTTAESVGDVVKRFGVRYAGWFNRKYGRVGPVFQGRFFSRAVETDAYLATLIRYVWNNPVAAGLVANADEYYWSSRRLLGVPGSLVDEVQLRALLPIPPEQLVGECVESLDEPVAQRSGGRPPRFSDDEARLLSQRVCGVEGPAGFALLDAGAQRRAIATLRTMGLPYAQIARVTGRSVGTIHRLHPRRSSPADGG